MSVCGHSVTGKVVVVTGATGNLGPAVVGAFAEAGARLALVARSEVDLLRVAADLRLSPEQAVTLPTDLTDALSTQAMAAAVIDRFGRADVLLHLAGGFVPGAPLAELPLANLRTLLDINLVTTFNAAQSLLPHLLANGWGRLVAVSSVFAQQPAARTSAYAAAKSAMEALVMAVAQEVKGQGVTANVVVVRTIDTPEARASAPKANTASWTTPQEVASALLLLCSDAAGTINGARIPLYGRG